VKKFRQQQGKAKNQRRKPKKNREKGGLPQPDQKKKKTAGKETENQAQKVGGRPKTQNKKGNRSGGLGKEKNHSSKIIYPQRDEGEGNVKTKKRLHPNGGK